MKKAFLHTALLFFFAVFLAGCSTEKNTRASRAYHNLTSKYNIYFNGHESMKAGLERIDQTVEDDFTRILPIFKESYPASGNAARADMDNAVLKASKLIQVHSITKKPKRQRLRTRSYQEFASQEEFNNWIDDSYLLIGRAYYYQHNFGSAVENFSYILRKFPKEELRYDAMVWLIRSYSELERFPEALELIQLLQSDRSFPGRLDRELARVTAHYYMQQKDYPETIKYLDICLKKNFSRKEKARLQFILAQLYRETGDEAKAVSAFAAVKKYNPPFKMAFNAFINAAGMFSEQGDPEKQKKELLKMARDEKYSEFRDQIYFALANIDLRAENREGAIENFRKSVATSQSNNYQRALSSVTLADIYFADLNYKESQAYYDSAMLVIDEDYPNFQLLEQRYTSLTRLVENLTVVEVQDSLQKLANMPEAERNSLIDKWISDVKEKQRQEELIAAAGQPQQGYYQSNEYRFGLGRSGEGSGWYFYNPQTVSFGKSQFQQRWGRRKLEDNWRRSNKNIVSEAEAEGFAELADSTQAIVRIDDPLQRDFYTQDIPLNDTLMAISHEKIRDALYNAGRIFKSDFSDYKNSAITYEDLNGRYPDNIYLLSVWFDLYDLYELQGDHARSQEYRDLIISRFPDSKYAKYLLNPNYFAELEMRQDSLNNLYQNTFRDYKAGRYDRVTAQSAIMKSLEPDTVMLSKIDFMDAVAKGARADMNTFEGLLKNYITGNPKAEPTPLASEILTLIQDSTLTDYQKLIELGYLHEEIQNAELEAGIKGENDEFGGRFSYDEDLLHYFVIAFPTSAKVDINRLKFDIANYNLDHYTKIDFDIEEEKLDANNTLLQVRALDNKENGLIYFRAIIRQPEVFRTLKDIDYVNFISSSINYRQILSEKSIADYLKFFLKNYSRFIGPDFREDEGEEESPEELMARARREDEALKERGTFVRVDVPVVEGEFALKLDTTQCFVLAVKDKNMSLRPVLNLMADFNRDKFRVWNLALQIKPAGDYQMIIVKGIPGYTEGMSYFRQIVTNRSIFDPLGTATYRNFIATDRNVEILLEKANIDNYMDFFRTNYIQRAGQVPAPSQEQQVPSSGQVTPTTGQPSAQTPATGQTTAATGQPSAQTPATGQTTAATGQPASQQSQVAYTGPYSTSIAKPHFFVLIVPTEGFDKAALLEKLRSFNTSKFATLTLQMEEMPLDDFRSIIRISGLANDEEARTYLRTLTADREVFAPLGNASYRNFIITGDNFTTFIEKKNITEYIDFYRQVYLQN